MAGLALSGDSAKAQGYVDEASRRWSAMVTPYLQGPATGGFSPTYALKDLTGGRRNEITEIDELTDGTAIKMDIGLDEPQQRSRCRLKKMYWKVNKLEQLI